MTLSPKAAKTVIIGLISRTVIKPEHVRSLITAWADSDPTSPESAAFWRQVFEAQGATHALRQNIRNPQMVRLMTLRAMLCPDTFPEYLNWLQPSCTSGPKSEPQATAEEFLQGPWSLELQQLKRQDSDVAEALNQSRRNALGAVIQAFPNAALPSTSVLWAWKMPGGFWQIGPQDWDHLFPALQGVRLSPALERFCLEVGDALKFQDGQPFYQIAAACRALGRSGPVDTELYDCAFPKPTSRQIYFGRIRRFGRRFISRLAFLLGIFLISLMVIKLGATPRLSPEISSLQTSLDQMPSSLLLSLPWPLTRPAVTAYPSDLSPDLPPSNLSASIGNFFTDSDIISQRLSASIQGQEYIIVSEAENQCLRIYDQRDYDGDGYTDALIMYLSGCGGNCCPNQFYLVSYRGNGQFYRSDLLGYSWVDPTIERWQDTWRITVTTDNSEAALDTPISTKENFILKDGQVVEVNEDAPILNSHLLTIQARDVADLKVNETRSFPYDLNDDGIPDQVIVEFWERWKALMWSAQFSNGVTIQSQHSCKRLGVLPTQTLRVHDLVCDDDLVYRWTGYTYMAEE